MCILYQLWFERLVKLHLENTGNCDIGFIHHPVYCLSYPVCIELLSQYALAFIAFRLSVSFPLFFLLSDRVLPQKPV